MSIVIKDIDMPLGCVYEDEDGNTQYCPFCNHEDIPYCTLELIKMPMEGLHFIEIDSRPEWCLLSTFEEPRKGEWIFYLGTGYGNPYGHFECSLCGDGYGYKTDFCPTCGADMRDKHDE